jgi:hypothetical protein
MSLTEKEQHEQACKLGAEFTRICGERNLEPIVGVLAGVYLSATIVATLFKEHSARQAAISELKKIIDRVVLDTPPPEGTA